MKIDLDLPTLADRQAAPQPKGLPRMLAKEERQADRDAKADAFRKAIWKRDKGRSRATGQKLVKSGTTDWHELGEVDHVIDRSLAPERLYDLGNGILLSKRENRLKKTPCPRAPEFRMFEVEGPDNRGLPQIFRWRDKDGKVTKETVG
jgi:hypothetical protein